MVFLNPSRNIAGFTLIEVLVSMMVMAISLTVIMSLFSGGLRSKKRAYDYNTAVELANNKIQDILAEENLEPGIQEGEFENGYSWKIEVVLDDTAISDSDIKIEQALRLYIINLKIVWEQGEKEKEYSISTMQVGEKQGLGRVHSS